MSQERQWVELDPTNGGNAEKPQDTPKDTNAEDTSKKTPVPADSLEKGA